MSQIPRLVWTGTKIFGRALREAGRQAVANATYKPEASTSTSDGGSSGGKNVSGQSLNNELRMTLEEAQLILNVKKEESMERVLEQYDRIFLANSPPTPPPTPDPKLSKPPTTTSGRRQKPPAVIYSHYMQSKVYRALERIKAERGGELTQAQGEGAGAEGAQGKTVVAGTAAESGIPPEELARAAAGSEPFVGAGPGGGPIPGSVGGAAEGQAGARETATGAGAGAGEAGKAEGEAGKAEGEEKREPIFNPAVGRAKPKGERVTNSEETISL